LSLELVKINGSTKDT